MQIKSIFNIGSLTLFLISSLIQLTLQKITISSPDELARIFNYEKIHANFANFGKVLYGYNFMGRLHYDLKDKDADYACKPLPSNTLDYESSPDQYPIVMVERGNCTFVTKARNVQKVGGLFALIVNNNDENIDKMILSDDGTGSDIYILTVLISKKDGEKIKKYMIENRDSPASLRNIVLSIEFRMPQRDRVEYQFFFNSASLEVYQLIKSFSKYQSILENSTDFRPHYVTHMSPDYDPLSQKTISNCISKGLYCSSPRYDLGITDGREIIYQNIRQKCIYFISKGIFKNSFIPQEPSDSLYWRYMETFYDNCLNKTVVQFNHKCSEDSQQIAGLNNKLVNDCIMSSYIPEKDKMAIDLNNNNTILEEEYNVKKNWKIKIFPTVMVNNKTLKGKVNNENLLEAVCAGFAVKPQVCYDESYFVKSSVDSSLSFSTVFFIVVIVILLNALIYLICRRYIIKRINEKIDKVDINGRINNVVTSYLKLKDSPA